jgi:3D (Asp-Asp-Asp) domain-containing protein/peptidoglycan hydrolase CwlO-like protein
VRHPNNRDGQLQIALWYLPALVRWPGRGVQSFSFAVLAGTAVLAMLPGGGAAETAGELERRAQALRAENARLAAGARWAVEDVATLESRLARTRAELASFRARTAQVRTKRQAVQHELAIVRSSVRSAQRAIAKRLQTVYEHGEADTLAVVLGATSLNDVLSAIETIDLAATQDEDLLEQARAVSTRLAALERALAARERELAQLAAVRAAAAAALAEARADRLRAIAANRWARRSNTATIADLEEQARALASAPVPGAPSLPTGSAASGVHTLTVVATAYSLPGRTASGRPVGWGAVAVDPSVIPMGSRLAVPGYGLGVAADVGSAIRGARIDLWFPTVAQARAWGSRVVSITVYSN